MSFEVACQIAIALLGGVAIYLVGRKDHLRRWGYVVGLISQPLWLYVTFAAAQWGMFALSCWYSFAWVNGIRNHWRN